MVSRPLRDARAGCVLKLGGSLFGDPPRLRDWLALAAAGAGGRIAIVPGGGGFADAVRDAQRRLGFDDGAAHRMALLAMAQSAEAMGSLQPALRCARSAAEVGAAWRDGAAALWQPFDLLDEPEVPSSWDLTSDSLAVWLAAQLQAPRLALVKWAPAPPGSGPADWVEQGRVDRAFATLARGFDGRVQLFGRDEVEAFAAAAAAAPDDAAQAG